MKVTFKDIMTNWGVIWKIVLSIIFAVATGTTLYASINNRVNLNTNAINVIEVDNTERDHEQHKFEIFMIRQEIQYQHIVSSLAKIEEKIESKSKSEKE